MWWRKWWFEADERRLSLVGLYGVDNTSEIFLKTSPDFYDE
jgi:hypothetical protein